MSWIMCPVLGVRDVRAAVEHFEQRLGFEVLSVLDGVDAEEGAVYGIVKREDAEVHLQIRRRALWSATRESIERDVYVRVADADAVYADVIARGAGIFEAPKNQPYGMRDFTVSAPEGLRISFGSRL